MSYILDALRRADSERERERSVVPGLHAQAVPAGAPDADGDTQNHPWRWPIAAAFVTLLGLVAWLWFDRAEAPPTVPALPAQAPMVAPAAPASAVAAVPPTGASAAAPKLAAGPPTAAASAALAGVAAATAVAATAAATPRETASAAARTPPPTAAKKSPPLPPKPAEPEPKVPSLAELPDDVRRELPAITVGGSIYSKSAANRMLVINGQVFHEGDALATGLVLEQIRQKSAVLRFRTYRYEITY